MKRFLVIQIMALFVIVHAAYGQFSSSFIDRRDSLTTTDGDAAYMDTVLYKIPVWDADISDTSSVFELLSRVDTTSSGSIAWYDSGCAPGVIVEMRYLRSYNR